MIVRWKPKNLEHFQAEFNGRNLDIVLVGKEWRIDVNGRRMPKEKHPSSAKAKARVETLAQKIIVELAQAHTARPAIQAAA